MKKTIAIYSLMIALMLCLASQAAAQTSVNVAVSADKSYTDNISLSPDSRDLDIMVKIQFDEADNALIVSLISYRNLFVFRDDARYAQVVKHNRINIEALPYVATAAPNSQFILTKPFKKLLAKDKKHFVFKRWIDVSGMQPQQQEYKMVNDFIEQKFDIKPGRDMVTFTLNDVIVMDKAPKSTSLKPKWDLEYWRRLDKKYTVEIERNPCFGRENAIAAAQSALEGAAKAWQTFKSNFPNAAISDSAQAQAFDGIKETLVKQFAKNNETIACPQESEIWEKYNLYVDSINAYQCHLASPAEAHKSVDEQIETKGIDASALLSIARTIDRLTSQWVNSKDPNERRTISQQCANMIATAENMVRTSPPVDDEQKKAYELFKNAAKFYNSIVRKQ